MTHLLPEIITDILSRLPVKTLLRFRCVSKPWWSLIDSPYFIKLHLNHSLKTNTNLTLIISRTLHDDLFFIDLDKLDEPVNLNNPMVEGEYLTEVAGSCNGLLALLKFDTDIVLWNPNTKIYQKLPIPQIHPPKHFLLYYSVYGFGYDPLTDDYKLVRLVHFDGTDYSKVEVYSLKANSWRRIRDFPYLPSSKPVCGVLVNDAVHWVVWSNYRSDTRDLIVAFDLRTEEYFEVPQPEYLDQDKDFYFHITVSGGCLCAVCIFLEVCVDVWVMKKYGVKDSWIKLFSAAHEEVEVYGGFEFIRPLAYSKCGDKVLLGQFRGTLIWYNLRRKKAEKFKIQGAPEKPFEVEMCVASLVPLSGQNGTNATKQQAPVKKKSRKRLPYL